MRIHPISKLTNLNLDINYKRFIVTCIFGLFCLSLPVAFTVYVSNGVDGSNSSTWSN